MSLSADSAIVSRTLPIMNSPAELPRRQRKLIEEFLHLFTDAESCLKRRLGRDSTDRTSVTQLIEAYEEVNLHWIGSAQRLRRMAEIRNLLTHQRGLDEGYPIAVAPRSLGDLRQLVEQLRNPEPVSVRFRRKVLSVLPNHSLAAVLELAFQKGFSQFPVVDEERFCGLITENEIVRWLGRSASRAGTTVDLSAVTVRAVLKEKDPFLRGIPIFCFVKLDIPIEEVMGRFANQPALEAVLLTESGRKDGPLEGIVTQWDAARYPH
jgi:predicted transcriptional regulator